jgi:hypothetical protein
VLTNCINGHPFKLRHKWKNNIKTNFKEIGLGFVDLVYVAWDRDLLWPVVNTTMILRIA